MSCTELSRTFAVHFLYLIVDPNIFLTRLHLAGDCFLCVVLLGALSCVFSYRNSKYSVRASTLTCLFFSPHSFCPFLSGHLILAHCPRNCHSRVQLPYTIEVAILTLYRYWFTTCSLGENYSTDFFTKISISFL